MHGVFASARNPIYRSMIVAMFGFALLVPTPLAWGAWLVRVVALQVQVRAIE